MGLFKSDPLAAAEAEVTTLEALTTRWERDRAKAALVMPSVAEIRWHDLRPHLCVTAPAQNA